MPAVSRREFSKIATVGLLSAGVMEMNANPLGMPLAVRPIQSER